MHYITTKETGICRENIRKYIKNYEAKLVNVAENLDEVEKSDIIEDITSKPKYSSSSRSKRALTDDVIKRISQFLKENEQKRLTGLSKQQKKKIDMYEVLLDECSTSHHFGQRDLVYFAFSNITIPTMIHFKFSIEFLLSKLIK